MQITVVGRHFEVTEPIKRYADEKLLKLERFSEKIKEAHTVLEVQKIRHIAEITLYLKYFKLTATEESRDMYAAIDKATGNLHKQLLKLRDRIKEHRDRRVSGKASLFKEFLKLGPQDLGTEKQKKPKVIRRPFQPKPMSLDEACLELDLFHENFLVFRNSETEGINVLYKREDGNYGLIAP
ncbi:MAG: ribosome-associated translation inhibitor RaiA [Candidatus Omnitrophica bacterium]|nr:ribosome-associated translation inhibitor RaiA [Candidatus Omnitrophota bacterium]